MMNMVLSHQEEVEEAEEEEEEAGLLEADTTIHWVQGMREETMIATTKALVLQAPCMAIQDTEESQENQEKDTTLKIDQTTTSTLDQQIEAEAAEEAVALHHTYTQVLQDTTTDHHMATSTTTTLLTPDNTMASDVTLTVNVIPCILKPTGKEEACLTAAHQETKEEKDTEIIHHTEVVEMMIDIQDHEVLQHPVDMARDLTSIKEGQVQEDPIHLK